MSFQAVAKATNRSSLVIGEISEVEAEVAREESPCIDGKGLYLLSVSDGSGGLGKVLAKFVSEDAAYELAQFFRMSGRLEVAS